MLKGGSSVRQEPHVFGAPAHKEQGRADNQPQGHHAEDGPSPAPSRVQDERGCQERHADFSQAVAHARQGEGAAAHADEPARDGDIDYHRAHERVARADEEPAENCKLPKIPRLTEEQKARAGNQAAGGHKPPSAMPIQNGAN